MDKRLELLLKAGCALLGLVLLIQLSRLGLRRGPLDDLNLPALSTLAERTTPKLPAAPTNSNSAPVPSPGGPSRDPRMAKANPPGGRTAGPANPLPEISAPVAARLKRITESEILGPVPRPLPMALLGIAGRDAFLRAPNGQTGLLKEGEELGGVKLLRLGTNRVLVEHAGAQQELMIFSGFGSETLLSKEKEKEKAP